MNNNIIEWLNRYNIKNYELLDIENELFINIFQDVNISNKNLTYLPVNIYEVWGHFNCQGNSLITTKGLPLIIHGNLNLNNNPLIYIDREFKKINGNLYLNRTKLNSLKGCPEILNGDLHCNDNNLINFIGMPKEVNGSVFASNNPLTSFMGCGKIKNSLYCSFSHLNSIKELKHIPEKLIHFSMDENYLIKELKSFYKHFFSNWELTITKEQLNSISIFNKLNLILENKNSSAKVKI